MVFVCQFCPDDVAHKWANKIQEEGRNSGNTFYFKGDSIFSYGGHFCIAKHVINEQRDRAVLFTTRGYSNTTAKHISIVRSASNHLEIIYCNDPQDSVRLNMEAFERKIKGHLQGLVNAKKPEKYILPAEQVMEQAKKYAAFFGVTIPKSMIELIESATTGKYKEYLVAEAERIEKERKERELKALAQFKKELAKWRKGETERLYGRLEEVDYLRIGVKRIETSQGVQIPFEAAKRAYKWIISTIKGGGCVDGKCNYRILDFMVSEVTKESVKIGCHLITLTEIKKIATKLNWEHE